MSLFNKKTNRIYLDYASLTPIDERVLIEMNKFSDITYANPSSLYREGVNAKVALKTSRIEIAKFINAHDDEIVFTSGGTESNNLAIIGAVEALFNKGVSYEGMHIITSAVEHSSVRECFNHLNNKGVKVDVIGVDKNGILDVVALKDKIRDNTVLISIMMVNNELGTIQPIKDIAKIIRDARKKFSENGKFSFQSVIQYPIFHSDTAQACSLLELNVEKLGIDLLTIDGAKIYGPRNCGALYIRRNIELYPVMFGGGQEKGLRSGTESLSNIAGLAKACSLILENRENEYQKIDKLRQHFIAGLNKLNKKVHINGFEDVGDNQSPHILSISIDGLDGEFAVLQLDARGISCSTKSSCLRDVDESYVLKAIGANSQNTLRFSFGRFNKIADIDSVIDCLRELST
jgi:cysteine desulfurase